MADWATEFIMLRDELHSGREYPFQIKSGYEYRFVIFSGSVKIQINIDNYTHFGQTGYSQIYHIDPIYGTVFPMNNGPSIIDNNYYFSYGGGHTPLSGQPPEIHFQSRQLNNVPSLTLKNQNGNIFSDNKSFIHCNKNDFLLTLNANDSDTSDTLQYMVTVRGNTIINYTNINKNTDTTITIPSSSFINGNNQVVVTVKDSNGATASKIFNIKGFSDLSLRGVYNIINS